MHVGLLLLVTTSVSAVAVAQTPSDPARGVTAERTLLLMGSRFRFSVHAIDSVTAARAIDTAVAEVARIEALISSWDPTSETSRLNGAGGAPVAIDDELFALIERSVKVSRLTRGAFDVSAAGLHRVYRFARQDTTLPDARVVADSRAAVGFEHIALDRAARTVRLGLPGMRIGFGAIGKGYAANRARELARAMPGVLGGVIDASGDLATFGRPPGDSLWHVRIGDPTRPGHWLGQVDVAEAAVVTSGDYERYFLAGGERHAHIVDPRTGYPTTGVASATVVCPDAELGDALATALFVLGAADGIALLDRLKRVEGFVVDASGGVHASRGLSLQPYAP